MAKKPKEPAKAAAPQEGDEAAPKKRSKLKLAIFALVPMLVLGGGGYAGYAFFLAKPAASHVAEGEHGEHGIDKTEVAGIPPEVAAENSFTYAYALAQLLKRECGGVETVKLQAASEAEAKADGMLVNLSWIAANRRLDSITQKSCNRMLVEVDAAEVRAASAGKPKDAKAEAHH